LVTFASAANSWVWSEQHVKDLRLITPMHVAAYIEQLKLAAPRPGFLRKCKQRYPHQHADFGGNPRVEKQVFYAFRGGKKRLPSPSSTS
jgi:hypothetical protein